MRGYFVADLNARGEIRQLERYDYAALEQVPGAAGLIATFSASIWRTPEEFEIPLPHPHGTMSFRWRSTASTAGICTLRSGGVLASMGLLATGLEPQADKITFEAFQRHLLRQLRQQGIEPGFDLVQLQKRPVVAIVSFLEPSDRNEQLILALADRCFAAAFFRYHDLA